MIVFELDIPTLTEGAVKLEYAFCDVTELRSRSMNDWLIDNNWDADALENYIRHNRDSYE